MKVDTTMLPSGKRIKDRKFTKGKNMISIGNFNISTDKDLSPEAKALLVKNATMMFNMLDQSIINKKLLSDEEKKKMQEISSILKTDLGVKSIVKKNFPIIYTNQGLVTNMETVAEYAVEKKGDK
tara:strand:- start:177 stop:551 length:375 start_codon:yes stop_codon:yes gene_type:complete